MKDLINKNCQDCVYRENIEAPILNLEEENNILKLAINDTYETSQEMLGELKLELDNYKKLVEHLKTLPLGTQELDYDYDDETILTFECFDWEYYIDNWFAVQKLEGKK